METLAFINNNDKIENYIVSYDEKLLSTIQNEIDKWDNNGEIIHIKCDEETIESMKKTRKMDILSMEHACNINSVNGPVKIYNYQYYIHNQCQLSLLCDYFIKYSNSPLEFSKCLGELYSWDSSSKKEQEFVNLIRGIFKFKKNDFISTVKSDISVEEKKSLLKRIKNSILKQDNNIREIISSETFANAIEEDAEKKIMMELKQKNIEDKENYKKILKRKIVDNIPKLRSL